MGVLDQAATLYGECIGAVARIPVTISQLDGHECELEPRAETSSAAATAIEGMQDLWIGAIGPLRVMAENRGGGRYRARFREPLDARIIAHFAQA